MTKLARCALVLMLIATLGLTLAVPAAAGQRIDYRGRTSQDGRIRLQVLKRDSGRGFLLGLSMFITFTCEDASTQSIRFGYGSSQRLGEDGRSGYTICTPASRA